jgi:hypothetical protein
MAIVGRRCGATPAGGASRRGALASSGGEGRTADEGTVPSSLAERIVAEEAELSPALRAGISAGGLGFSSRGIAGGVKTAAPTIVMQAATLAIVPIPIVGAACSDPAAVDARAACDAAAVETTADAAAVPTPMATRVR